MNKETIKFTLSLILMGTIGVASRFIHLEPYEIPVLRTSIGTIFLLIIFFIKKEKWTIVNHKEDILPIFISGALLGLGWIFLHEGFAKLGVSLTIVLYYVGPAIVMILTPFLYKEEMTNEKIIGFTIVMIGVVFVNFNMFKEKTNLNNLIYGVLALLTYSGLLISNRYIKSVKGLENTILQLISAFIVVYIYKIFRNGFAIKINVNDLPYILYLCIVDTGISSHLYYSTLNNLPMQTACILGYVDPLSSLVFSYILLHERLMPIQIVGAMFIMSGVLIAQLLHINKLLKQ